MTVIVLTSGTSWTVPSDWNSTNNRVECIGGGAGGGSSTTAGSPAASGGGGGAYAAGFNIALTPGANVTYGIGAAGGTNAPNGNGIAGGNTYFNGTSLAACSAGAEGGFAGQGATSPSAASASGGRASASVGTIKYNGGASGSVSSSGASGGGGAGGPNGAGGGSANASNSSTAGGGGDNGYGGAGGAPGGANGGNGTAGGEFGSVGCGGGGGGAINSGLNAIGGSGGPYGGGGGGGSGVSGAGGGYGMNGYAGLIVITYIPKVALTANPLVPGSPVFGTPMLGVPLNANNLAPASPVFGAPVLVQGPAAIDLVTGSPVLGVPGAGFLYLLTPTNLVTSSPEFGTPGPALPQPVLVYPPGMDRHVRRSGDDYAQALLSLLPHGPAWLRDAGTMMVLTLTGLAQYWGFVDGRAADLLERESDPRATLELLPDWERNWGLPDPCFIQASTIGQRQALLVMKMTLLGAQSREFFITVASWLGYTISISEFAPFMAGVSNVGDTRTPPLNPNPLIGDYRWYIGPPEMRFYWTVHVGSPSLIWFRASKGQAGVDPHLRIGIADDLECLLRRWKPAHTDIVFDYSTMRNSDPMAGTP